MWCCTSGFNKLIWNIFFVIGVNIIPITIFKYSQLFSIFNYYNLLFFIIFQDKISCPSPECKPVLHGEMGCGQKKLSVSVAVPPAPVRVPSQRPLALSVSSVKSVANDEGDNEMILGLCTDLLAFALQPRKTPENLS